MVGIELLKITFIITFLTFIEIKIHHHNPHICQNQNSSSHNSEIKNHIPQLILIRTIAHLAVKVDHMDFEATFFHNVRMEVIL